MKKVLKVSLMTFFILSLLFANKALAEEVNADALNEPVLIATDENQEAMESVEAVINDATDEPEDLEEVSVVEPDKVPSAWSMFWQGLKEDIAIAFTFNQEKKAEKRLAYAQNRIQIANYILENSTDKTIQERAQKMLEKANAIMEKVQEKAQLIYENRSEAKARMLENMSRLELNAQRVLGKIEDKASIDQLEKINALRTNIETRQERFFENFLNNENIPNKTKQKMLELKEQIEIKKKEQLQVREEHKALLEKALAGDEAAKIQLEEQRKVRQEAKEKIRTQIQEKKQEIINQIITGEAKTIGELKNIEAPARYMLQKSEQILEQAKIQSQNRIRAETQAQIQQQNQSETQTQTETRSQTQTQTGTQSQTQTQTETQSQTGTRTQQKTGNQ